MPSLKDKVGKMNSIALKLADAIDKNKDLIKKFTDKESDTLYGIADGLTEEFIMRMVEGRTSLANIQKWTPEKLEAMVDSEIVALKKMAKKMNVKV